MNTLSRFLLAALFLLGLSSASALAQVEGRVTTGVIEKISPETGVMTVRSQQTQRPMTFYGIDKAMLEHTLGKQPAIGDLAPGMPVTIRYAARGNQWFVDKITYGESAPGPGTLTGNATPTNVTGATAPVVPPTLNPQQPATGEIVPEQAGRGGSVGRNRSGGTPPKGPNLLQ